uniref:Uncharacterized protein n=1 Tax=Anguilla anguilla TaxID=7936 RepID=A0A0E9W2Q0_ANGAN
MSVSRSQAQLATVNVAGWKASQRYY